jgi:transcriptional regulator with XRE-family HTH domain
MRTTASMENDMVYVNPARILTARMRRGMTSKKLAEEVGEQPRTIAKWVKPSDYSLDLTEAQIARLVLATSFPAGWFTGGDEEEDFATIEEIARQVCF